MSAYQTFSPLSMIDEDVSDYDGLELSEIHQNQGGNQSLHILESGLHHPSTYEPLLFMDKNLNSDGSSSSSSSSSNIDGNRNSNRDGYISDNSENNNSNFYENNNQEVYLDNSFIVLGMITFVGDSSRGILFPILYSLTVSLGGTMVEFGYIVAMFSMGRLLSTIPLGYLCDIYRHKIPLIVSSFLVCFGAILWANCYGFQSLPLLYFSQLMLGIGSGTLGLTRSYVVEHTEPSKRTEIIGLLTSLQYAGFTISPILGSGIAAIGNMTNLYWMYALPGYTIAILSIICIFGLYTVFKDVPVKPTVVATVASSSSSSTVGSSSSPSTTISTSTASPRFTNRLSPHTISELEFRESITIQFLMVAMILLNVTTKGSIAVFETLGAEILIDDYDFTIFAVGVLISIAGSIGTFHLVMFKSFWTKYFNDIELMLGGIALMIIAQLILLSYGSIPSLYRYIAGVVIMYGFGYPIGHTAVIGAFSKIQKSGPQAALMSWFATAGSIARVVLPIGSDYLDNVLDNSPFCVVLFLLSVSYIMIIVLKPLIIFYIEEPDSLRYTNSSTIGQLPSIWTKKYPSEWLQMFSMVCLATFSLYALIYLAPISMDFHRDSTLSQVVQ